ncbi:uncharacterized protein A4U43_C08F31400 [Asparagus officinalis]|nr:uncharacterized protein A4U43_C08F31400 [Asparagus officinalis]
MLSGNDNGDGKNTKKVSVSFTDVARPPRPPSPPPQSRRTSAQPSPPARTNEPFKTAARPSLPPPPARSYEPYHLPPLPPVHRPGEKRVPPVPVQLNEAPPKKQHEEMDISHRMLSLLIRCNDIVSRLRSLPGFVPYCPL